MSRVSAGRSSAVRRPARATTVGGSRRARCSARWRARASRAVSGVAAATPRAARTATRVRVAVAPAGALSGVHPVGLRQRHQLGRRRGRVLGRHLQCVGSVTVEISGHSRLLRCLGNAQSGQPQSYPGDGPVTPRDTRGNGTGNRQRHHEYTDQGHHERASPPAPRRGGVHRHHARAGSLTPAQHGPRAPRRRAEPQKRAVHEGLQSRVNRTNSAYPSTTLTPSNRAGGLCRDVVPPG